MDIETFFMKKSSPIFFALAVYLLMLSQVTYAQSVDSLDYVFHLENNTYTVKSNRLDQNSSSFQLFALQMAWNRGYFDARLDSVQFLESKVQLWFNEGIRYTWNKPAILWSYDLKLKYGACNRLDSDHFFIYDHLSECLYQISSNLIDNAYLNPKISIDSLEIDSISKRVRAHILIEKGFTSRFDNIVFEGLTKIDADWLKRVARLDSSREITNSNLTKSVEQLNRLRFFEPIDSPILYRNNEEYIVKFRVDERPLTHFDILGGYVPSSSGNSILVGRGELKLRNVGFDGLDLMLFFDRIDARVGKMNFKIDQNYILGYPIGATSSFSLIQQDTLWQSRNVSLGMWFGLSDEARVLIEYTNEVSVIGNTIDQDIRDQKGSFGTVGLHYSTRQGLGEAEPGWIFYVKAETGNQRILDGNGFNLKTPRKRVYLQSETHIRVLRRHNIVSGLNIGYLFKENPQLTDLWRLGGAKSIRGYREDQFFSQRYIWSDLEYRYFIEQSSYVFAFGQLGRININESIKNSFRDKYTRSYGFGLAYTTNLGLLKFTYAKSPEDPLINAKVHLGIQADF
jgi:translocation and assembly module TamA